MKSAFLWNFKDVNEWLSLNNIVAIINFSQLLETFTNWAAPASFHTNCSAIK